MSGVTVATTSRSIDAGCDALLRERATRRRNGELGHRERARLGEPPLADTRTPT